MAEYYAKSNNSLSFEVEKDDQSIGKLIYTNWFSFKAEMVTLGHSYKVEPKGFWGTTIELKDHERVLLKFRMNWNGEIVIQTYFDGVKDGFLFKHRGIFKDSFVLTEYQIITSESFEVLSNKEILLLNSLHCANYYMSMIAVV